MVKQRGGSRRGDSTAEVEASAEVATRKAALGAVHALEEDIATKEAAGPDARINEVPLPKRCWWPPMPLPTAAATAATAAAAAAALLSKEEDGQGGAPAASRSSWPDAPANAARLSEIGRALLSSEGRNNVDSDGGKGKKRQVSTSSSDFDVAVAPFVDEEALGRAALVSGLLAVEAAETAALAAEEEGREAPPPFVSSVAPALVSLALGGDPALAAPSLAALQAAWSLDSVSLPCSSSISFRYVAEPPSAGQLLRALAAAGVALGGSAVAPSPTPEQASSSSSPASSSAEFRLSGLRLLARTIRASALACIRSGGKGSGSSGKAAVTAAKDNSRNSSRSNNSNPFGELPGVELFAALSALRGDPSARLAEPEIGDAAGAVLGAFLRQPSSSSSSGGGPSSSAAERTALLLRKAAEGAFSFARSSPPSSSSFCARSALEAVRRVPSSSSTAAGPGADLVRSLAAAFVALLLAEARRGGGAGGESKGTAAARSSSSSSAVAEELVQALKPSSPSGSSSSRGGALPVAEAAPAAVVAVATKLLEGEWFTLGGAALVRGIPPAAVPVEGEGDAAAAAAASPVASPAPAQHARAPRTARLLLEAADEALWPAVEAEVAATVRRVARKEEEEAATAAANGGISPSPSPVAAIAPFSVSEAAPPRSALAARWLPFVRAVDREAARGRSEPDRLLQLAAASMAQRYTVAASAVRVGAGVGRAAYGRAGAVGLSSPI